MIEINGGRNFNNEYQLAKFILANPDFEAYVTNGKTIQEKRRAASIIANIHLEKKRGGSWEDIVDRAARRL